MIEPVGTLTLIQARAEGLALIIPIKSEIGTLTVTDADSYLIAEMLLSRVMRANKIWQERIDKIIVPMRKALDEVYALKNEIKHPFDGYETDIKAKMKTFKLEEARQLRIAEEARQAEIRKAADEARIQEEKAAAARTRQMREKLTVKAAESQQKVSTLTTQGPQEAVKGTKSSVKTKRVWQVTDMVAFCKAVGSGEIPTELVEVNRTEMNQAYSIDAETVAGWPGVSIVEDITISGRR